MSKTRIDTLNHIYVIFSEQRYLVNEALKRLKSKILSQTLGELNIVEFSAPLDFEEVEQALNTVGFFEQRKVVIVNQADKLNAAQIKKIDDYYQKNKNNNASSDTTLVLAATGKNDALFKQAKADHYFYDFKSPKGSQVASWVIDHFAAGGKKVNFEAANYLTSLLGTDLDLIANEIDKISLYYDSKQNLQVSDIAKICANQAHETIFDLVDALGQADLSAALTNLSHLFHNESDSKIFFMIVRQFRLLLKTKGLLSENATPAQIAQKLRLPSFVIAKYIKQARHFSSAKLISAHRILLNTEISFKTTATPLNKSLELALVKILAA